MKTTSQHIVNQVFVDVACNSLQYETLKNIPIGQTITAGIETAFDTIERLIGEKTVQLDQVSIDISIDDVGNFFPDLIENALVGEVKEILSQTEFEKSNASANARGKTIPTSEETFLYFLKYGIMNWFSERSEQVRIKDLSLTEKGFLRKLKTLLKSNRNAVKRLVFQFDSKDVLFLIGNFSGASKAERITSALAWIGMNTKNYTDRFGAAYRLEKKFLEYSLVELLNSSKNHGDPTAFFQACFYEMHRETKTMLNGGYQQFLKDFGEQFQFSEDLGGWARKGTPPTHGEIEDHGFVNAKEIPVRNAGIILLNPFLKTFFEKVGLLENRKFISEAHRQRGICLLHFLATGTLEFPEEDLNLAKFLCGYRQDRPVPRNLPISQFEQEEALSLLQSVINYWSALKNTSAEGLRQNFLQRRGLLIQDELSYVLHIEQQTPDILLSQLPWGISMAQFPWLEYFITIKWH